VSTETTETSFDLESAIANAAAAKREREEAYKREREEAYKRVQTEAIDNLNVQLSEALQSEIWNALGITLEFVGPGVGAVATFDRGGRWQLRNLGDWRIQRPDDVWARSDIDNGNLQQVLLEMIAEWDELQADNATASAGEAVERVEAAIAFAPEVGPALEPAPQFTVIEDYSSRRTILLDCSGASYNRTILAVSFDANGSVEIWRLTNDSECPEVALHLSKNNFQKLLVALEQWQAEQAARSVANDDEPPF